MKVTAEGDETEFADLTKSVDEMKVSDIHQRN